MERVDKRKIPSITSSGSSIQIRGRRNEEKEIKSFVVEKLLNRADGM